MDENKTRADVEETTAEETAGLAPAAAEETAVLPVAADEQALDGEEIDEDEIDVEEDVNRDPMDDTVIGMPRMCFYGVLFGYGIGAVLLGLIGLVTGIEFKSTLIPCIICAAIGYYIGKVLNKRRIAARDAQNHDVQQ